MRSALGRRRRLAVAFLSACVVVLMGATTASAGALLFHYEGSPVKLSVAGGNIPILRDCLAAVAGGGSPTSNICGQFVTSDDTVTVRANNVLVTELPASFLWQILRFAGEGHVQRSAGHSHQGVLVRFPGCRRIPSRCMCMNAR